MGLSRFHKTIHLLLALSYLVLGVAAVWHAPHFSQAKVAIGSDRHSGHEAILDAECALCTVKTAPQQSVTRFVHSLAASVSRATDTRRLYSAVTLRVFAGRPRAPPSLLS